jgi:hypothetical protein
MIQDDHDNNDNNIKSINLTVHINYTGSIIYYRIYLLHKHSKASSSYIHRYMEIIRSRHKKAAKYGDGWMASAYNITPDKFGEKMEYAFVIHYINKTWMIIALKPYQLELKCRSTIHLTRSNICEIK